MGDPTVRAMDGLRIDAIELTHAASQVGVGRLDQQMVMIRHLAPGMATPVENAHTPETEPRATPRGHRHQDRSPSRPSPREVTWYSPTANSMQSGLAMAKHYTIYVGVQDLTPFLQSMLDCKT